MVRSSADRVCFHPEFSVFRARFVTHEASIWRAGGISTWRNHLDFGGDSQQQAGCLNPIALNHGHEESGVKREINGPTRRHREGEKEKTEDRSTSRTSAVGVLQFRMICLALCAIYAAWVGGAGLGVGFDGLRPILRN